MSENPETTPAALGATLKIVYGVFLLALLGIPLTVTGWTDQFEDKVFLIRTVGPLLAVILVIILSGRELRTGPLPPLPVLIAGLFAAQLFSLVDVINMGIALTAVTRFVGFAAFFVVARHFAQFPAYRNGIITVFVIVGLATAVYGIAQHFGYDFIDWKEHREVPTHRGTSFMGHATYAASVLIMLMPLSAALFLETRNTLLRVICVLAISLMLYHLSFTAARVATAAFVIAIGIGIATLLIQRRQSGANPIPQKWYVLGACAVMLFGGLMVNRAWQAKDSDPLGLLEGGMAQRLFAWETANRMFLANPVNGVGIGNYEIASPPYWTEAERVRYSLYLRALYQPHNRYFETAAETGLPGILCLLGIIAVAASRCLSGLRQIPRLYTGLIIALCASALDAAFLFPWQVPDSGLIFWVLLGLIDGAIPQEIIASTDTPAAVPAHS